MANLDVDWRRKILTAKFTVYHLNEAGDFENWHTALRKVVGYYEMGAALLFSIPQDEKDRYIPREDHHGPRDSDLAARIQDDDEVMPELLDADESVVTGSGAEAEAKSAENAEEAEDAEEDENIAIEPLLSEEAVTKLPEGEAKIYAKLMEMLAQSKKHVKPKAEPRAKPAAVKREPTYKPKPVKPYYIDLTLDDDRPATSAKQKDLMARMGVSYLNEFFSPSTAFISGADGKVEKEPQTFYRHEIWNWCLRMGGKDCVTDVRHSPPLPPRVQHRQQSYIYLFRARIRKDIYPAAEGRQHLPVSCGPNSTDQDCQNAGRYPRYRCQDPAVHGTSNAAYARVELAQI